MRTALLLLGLLAVVACGVDHGSPEPMPNEGSHADVPCDACHGPDRAWDDVPSDCAGCHDADRPDAHAVGACESCHDLSGWPSATLAHAGLPLEEGHGALLCGDCHRDRASFEGASADCAVCHARPGPVAHFTGDCARCHDLASWSGAVIDPDLHLPLPHGGRSDCIGCHRAPDRPEEGWSCDHCHAHNPAAMDEAHVEVPQFQTDRERCLRCHPTALAD